MLPRGYQLPSPAPHPSFSVELEQKFGDSGSRILLERHGIRIVRPRCVRCGEILTHTHSCFFKRAKLVTLYLVFGRSLSGADLTFLLFAGFFDGTELMVQLASAGALMTGATFLVDMLAIWVFKQKDAYRKLKFDDSDDHNIHFGEDSLLDVPAVLSGDERQEDSEKVALLQQSGGSRATYGATNP